MRVTFFKRRVWKRIYWQVHILTSQLSHFPAYCKESKRERSKVSGTFGISREWQSFFCLSIFYEKNVSITDYFRISSLTAFTVTNHLLLLFHSTTISNGIIVRFSVFHLFVFPAIHRMSYAHLLLFLDIQCSLQTAFILVCMVLLTFSTLKHSTDTPLHRPLPGLLSTRSYRVSK